MSSAPAFHAVEPRDARMQRECFEDARQYVALQRPQVNRRRLDLTSAMAHRCRTADLVQPPAEHAGSHRAGFIDAAARSPGAATVSEFAFQPLGVFAQ